LATMRVGTHPIKKKKKKKKKTEVFWPLGGGRNPPPPIGYRGSSISPRPTGWLATPRAKTLQFFFFLAMRWLNHLRPVKRVAPLLFVFFFNFFFKFLIFF
jgi:hypothetical protein